MGGALVAWGGASQRGSVYVDIPGAVCAACDDFATVVEWLEHINGRLTRVDIAGDDFTGDVVSVDWALAEFRAGGFSRTGRTPSAKFIDDMGGNTGRTLYVGKRANGKLACVYEKGKQLGDAVSRWCRVEVRWGCKDRVIPYAMLLRPAEFLAGAFPCTAFFATVKERVRTFKERARISYGRAVAIARQHAGRVVNAILVATHGDIGEVVTLLRRSGLPSRLNPADMARLAGA